MKRDNFICEIVKSNCYLKRHGKKHDIYINPKNGKHDPIPPLFEIK